jgi:hypothetical protein
VDVRDVVDNKKGQKTSETPFQLMTLMEPNNSNGKQSRLSPTLGREVATSKVLSNLSNSSTAVCVKIDARK